MSSGFSSLTPPQNTQAGISQQGMAPNPQQATVGAFGNSVGQLAPVVPPQPQNTSLNSTVTQQYNNSGMQPSQTTPIGQTAWSTAGKPGFNPSGTQPQSGTAASGPTTGKPGVSASGQPPVGGAP